MMRRLSTVLWFYHGAAIALAFFSFFMAALVSRTVFERLPHLEDEMAYIYQARIFARGEVVIETPQPWRAFWQPFVLEYRETGSTFGKYSPGWPAMLAIGVILGQMWVINALAAALTVALVYRLGLEIFDPDVGLIAAALTAFSPMALLLNATYMSHTTALTLFTLFMYAFWRIDRIISPQRGVPRPVEPDSSAPQPDMALEMIDSPDPVAETPVRTRSHARSLLMWGLLAGAALGLLTVNRPLTAIAVVVPFVLWAGLRVIQAALDDSRAHQGRRFPQTFARLRPYLALSVVTIMISAAIPLFNLAAVDDPGYNLYTLVWPYDQVGFGTCCGRSSLPENGGEGHTIVKGVRHARFDLSLTAADLFGWHVERDSLQPAAITDPLVDHLRNQADYWEPIGLGFFIIALGLLAGLRPPWAKAWIVIGILWLVIPMIRDEPFLKGFPTEPEINDPYDVVLRVLAGGGAEWDALSRGNPNYANAESIEMLWRWLGIGALWMVVPPLVLITRRQTDHQTLWTWLLLAVFVAIVGLHLAYWIGSQRYSTRYYYEALTALMLIAALFFAQVGRFIGRPALYGALSVLLLFGLYTYSTPRIGALRGFNFISQALIEEVESRRTDDRPVLVIVTGVGTNDVRWRSYGALMAVTDPFLDSEIVAARDFAPNSDIREQLLAMFPDRQVIDLNAAVNERWFPDEPAPDSVGMTTP
jgi:hypothetical protein